MSAATIVLVSVALIFGGDSAASASSDLRASFTKAVEDYQMFVTPFCLHELPSTYNAFNSRRDSAFLASLVGTELRARYRDAVRGWTENESHIVRHCDGPPPAPMPGSSAPPDPRAVTIAQLQQKLRSEAASVPQYFDEGDRVFSRMIALRDEILGRKAP